MADTAKLKFEAAVKVIRGLPKNGTFQPSHEMMLKFYGFYKQSTVGPCKQGKPGFWDVVKKAKWEAWSKLGEMPRERAMLSYVEELKTIIETMPQTKEVGDFIDRIGSFYEMIEEKDSTETTPVKRLQNGGNYDSDEDEKEVDSESNISFNNDADVDQNFNHSAAVEEIMRKSEFINRNKAHITVTENQTVHQRVLIEKPKLNVKTDGFNNTNGRMNGEKEERSGSESDEFCDTSDEPIQESVIINGQVNTSTPASKDANHVRFSDVIQTEAQIHQITPVTHASNHRDLRLGLLSNSVPFSSRLKSDAVLSDSMLVNTALNDTLNWSIDSQLGDSRSHPDSSIFNQSDGESVVTRGGGNVHKGQGSIPVSSDNFTGFGVSRGIEGNLSGSRRGLFPPTSGGSGEDNDGVVRGRSYGDLNEQIAVALVRLQQDMNGVLSRLTNLEAMTEQQNQERERREMKKSSGWWTFGAMSKKTVAFIIIWPFLAHFIISLACRRKRRW